MYYGQFQEDWQVEELLPHNFEGTAVEVGAYDGMWFSNTYYFERQGWKTLAIEPIPDMEDSLKLCRDNYLMVAVGRENKDQQPFDIWRLKGANMSALSSLREKGTRDKKEHAAQIRKHQEYGIEKIECLVDIRTLDWCLETTNWPKVDFVSIDTEGTDMDVLEGFSIDKWQPSIILMENWSEDSRFEEYLEPYGFHLEERIQGQNELYVHKERLEDLNELSD